MLCYISESKSVTFYSNNNLNTFVSSSTASSLLYVRVAVVLNDDLIDGKSLSVT